MISTLPWRTMRRPGALAARLFLGGVLCVGCTTAEQDVSPEAARQEAEAWRAKHEADYRRDWVTIAGLHFLKEGAQTVGSSAENDIVLGPGAPPNLGRVMVEGGAVRFEPHAAAGAQVNGAPVATAVALADDIPGPADEITAGGVRLVVHQSGERSSLRVWNPTGPLATGFLGFTWFDIQPAYRVIGRFIPDAAPRAARVQNTFGDIDEFQTEGVVEFTLEGRTLRLRPFTTRPKRFYFVFRDASGGAETYEAARFLYADLRDDGTTVLDFNQAYNPPCAFNPYTTCPIPLPENRLPVKILAGERAYPVHVALPAS